eukprot:CCRYP_021241-RB/>CCRYP_021241-RB protein AED:0.49 eAED:0.49 QI:0/-1/0/1/-1/0/1/0/22
MHNRPRLHIVTTRRQLALPTTP